MSAIGPELDGLMRAIGLPDSVARQSLHPRTTFMRLPFLLAAVLVAACFSVPAAAERSAYPSGSERRAIVPFPQAAPATDAAEALRRLLALVDMLHEPQDLTPERVAELSGLTLLENRDGSGGLEGHQSLSVVWRYGYRLWREFHTQQTAFAFWFYADPDLHRRPPSKTDICALDMDQFHEALLGMGFTNTSNVRSGHPEQRYRRGRVALNMSYTGESATRVTHDCIDRVFVSFPFGKEMSR